MATAHAESQSGNISNALVSAAAAHELLYARWARIIGPSLGWDPEDEGLVAAPFMTVAMAVFGPREVGTSLPRTLHELKGQVIATMGYPPIELPSISRMFNDAESIVADGETGRVGDAEKVTSDDVNRWVALIAAVAASLEGRYPEMVRSPGA